ncbi:MAG: NADP-dependent malic enzyme [Myxococcales bacterium]|nr:NADP-dependent malic enzyme [Myxococcales bacterium]
MPGLSEALRYHAEGRPGKIEVVSTKPCLTQRDLSLAYSPGVAEPCLAIAADPDAVFDYTARANLVAVVTNGTAVLGLGDIGPLAAKPVMEGKGILFKKFADIDVFDLELDERDPARLVDIIAALAPTFGGINLEDIKAPECFEVERLLRERIDIPVFHDDQHGTAIITGAGLLNAADLQGKALDSLQVVVSGAGASAISCMELWCQLGVRREHITMCDSKGVLHTGRRGQVDASKERFLRDTPARTLTDALVGADVFVGLSVANVVTAAMIAPMAPKPIIFALANPDPEIPYPIARAARPDAVIGTGRSDFPNQVNNVLGFPFIFRGALDVHARRITEPMKLAAARAIAQLAREDVPDRVREAYGGEALRFGRDYILPKPLDERVLLYVAPAVARAAMESGVARRPIDLATYRDQLERRLAPSRSIVRAVIQRVAQAPSRIAFAEAEDERVLRAVALLVEDGIARPVLLGDAVAIRQKAADLGLKLDGVEFVALGGRPTFERDLAELLRLRGRKGLTAPRARTVLNQDATTAALMMLHAGEVDGLVAGLQHGYPETIRRALQLVGLAPGVRAAAGAHVLVTKQGPMVLADTTVNIEPDAAMLADIALMAAEYAEALGLQPRVAMLSFSNFGQSAHAEARKVSEAVRLLRQRAPNLQVDGEMQVQVALDPVARARVWPQSRLEGVANVLVFPSLAAANTAYQLLARAGGSDEIGPVLLGLARPVTVLPPGAAVDGIVRIAAFTALRALAARAVGPAVT